MDPISVLIRSTDLLGELPLNEFSIELETNDEVYTIEKANNWVWAVESLSDHKTIYIKHENLITYFYREYITRVTILKEENFMTMYELKSQP